MTQENLHGKVSIETAEGLGLERMMNAYNSLLRDYQSLMREYEHVIQKSAKKAVYREPLDGDHGC